MARRAEDPQQGAPPGRNEVALVGRVAAAAEERELPSGDVLATFRLVLERPPAPRPGGGRPVTVDTFDCACWTPGTRRTARGLAAGDVVELSGALRRRFWRAGAAPASRCEVEVAVLRRLVRAPAPAPKRRRAAKGAPEAASVAEVSKAPSGAASASEVVPGAGPASAVPTVAAEPAGLVGQPS